MLISSMRTRPWGVWVAISAVVPMVAAQASGFLADEIVVCVRIDAPPGQVVHRVVDSRSNVDTL